MNHQSPATLAIVNGRLFTADDAQPAAEAVAVRDGTIVFVGSNEEIQTRCDSKTHVIDARRRTVLPGLIDTHFHLEWGARTLVGAQLYGVTSLESLTSALHLWVKENTEKPWILGQGCSYAIPSKNEPLTRQLLDEIIADRPVVLTAFDMHSMFVNTAALKAAGIFDDPPQNLENGAIVMGSEGRPTGELYEMDAMNFIYRALPGTTPAERTAQVKVGLDLAASKGITSMHNMDGDYDQTALYAIMEDRDLLTARISMPYWVKPEDDIPHMLEHAKTMRSEFNTPLVRAGRVKFFMDGVYESYTAVALDGYPDQPENYGEPIWDRERFAAFAAAADAAGLQIATHACGDGAVRRVLDGYEAARRENGARESRHRVEHIEMISPDDLPRFVELGVTASMQPLHAPLQENDPDVWPTRIHREQYDRAFAWRSLREAGARVVFGSDWPVVPLDPLLGIWGAVNRRPFRPGAPEHRQGLTETLLSYTRDAAWADFQEGVVGRIKPGLAADVVILSDDIFAVERTAINDLKVDLTVFNGKIVYQNKE